MIHIKPHIEHLNSTCCDRMCAEKNQQILNASMVKTSQVSKLAEKSKQLAKSNGYMFEIERYK